MLCVSPLRQWWNGRVEGGNKVFLNNSQIFQLNPCNISMKQVVAIGLFALIASWEELKGSWEVSVPFWNVGIRNYREKSEETHKGPAEKSVLRHSLERICGCVSPQPHLLCLIWIFTFSGGTCSKPFIPLTLPDWGDFISTSEIRESRLYDPQPVFSRAFLYGWFQ